MCMMLSVIRFIRVQKLSLLRLQWKIAIKTVRVYEGVAFFIFSQPKYDNKRFTSFITFNDIIINNVRINSETPDIVDHVFVRSE